MKEKLEQLSLELNKKLEAIKSLKELNDLKTEYFGKKSPINELSSLMNTLSNEEKKEQGKLLNEVKLDLNNKFEILKIKLEENLLNEQLQKETIDITLPGITVKTGSIHPLQRVIDELEDLFISMGYDVVEGPEIETDLYCFERLNVPKEHPARDMQDSFYIDDEYLLRTQTSAIQARTMENNKEKDSIRIICPGRTYRRDDDATHSHNFIQLEGLVIDKNISLSHLKGTLEMFAKKMFNEKSEVRFRPSFFPFTEPSLEVDISCFKCNGKGCSFCKNTGFIEILGAGMVHPNVLKMGGYNTDIYSGFAFGIGIERVAMLKYGINDIRNFYTNDLRFIDNFNRIDGGVNNETK
ncbi:MAG: phenylalanine--tRNA ligase subunit alpha [Bacilli bacterium]